ncbi:MAG TPA: PDZ domain-containing protein [Bacillota bacterium]|nr:PDZ domain-containing protein [Bacillota bacterium]
MLPLTTLGMSYLRALPQYLSMPLFYIVLFLIYTQYRRAASLEKALYGRPMHSIIKHLVISTLFGVAGGLIGSMLLLSLGVAISGNWILYVWVVALGLAFISPRLMCFAYGGGIVALVSLILGWPEIDIASLLGLVAVLHAVESVLMLLSGHIGAVPVRVKNSIDGSIVGAYSLQKFWPVPLLALAVAPGIIPPEVGAISMPDWWPLIIPAGLTLNHSFWMIPVVAGLGYGEMAVSTTPRARARQSALKLAVYSGVLFVLAYLAGRVSFFLYVGAIFAPLGHELLVWTTNRQEMGGRALHKTVPGELRVFDILPDSPAWGKLASGERILACDGMPMTSVADLSQCFKSKSGLEVLLTCASGDVALPPGGGAELRGIILIPDDSASTYLETRFHSPLDFLSKYLAGDK